MKWCVQFPEEEILIKRPCLRRACAGNKNAATLLSYLLYQVSISQEFKQLTEQQNGHTQEALEHTSEQCTTITIYKTQQEILAEMDYEISERTLRSVAIPLLIEYGYIDIDGSGKTNRYTIHLAQIQAGITAPPTRAAILPILHQCIEDGKIAASYRQNCRQVPAKLPLYTGKIAEFSGNFAGVKNRHESSAGEPSASILHEDKSKSNKDITKRREEATHDTDQTVKERETKKATTLSLSQEKSFTIVSAHHQNQYNTLAQPVHRPDVHGPRTVEAIVQLIETLRGQQFDEQERPQQLHAAHTLLELKPALSLTDMQEAWLHGSDVYWRQHHDDRGMTALDLAHHNSHGKRRVIAALEHKRQQTQQRRHQQESRASGLQRDHLHSPSVAVVPPPKYMMTEQEAQALALQIKRDGEQYNYPLQAQPLCKETIWMVNVQLEQHMFRIQSRPEWTQRFPQIQQVMQLKQRLNNIESKEQTSWSA